LLGVKTVKKNKKAITILLIILCAVTLLKISPILARINHSQSTDLHLDGDGVVVLCYHRVIPGNFSTKIAYRVVSKLSNDDELKLYSILSSDFEDQIKYLKEEGIHFITISELEDYVKNRIILPKKSALITFDDVDVSVYNTAFPILNKEKIPFALFLITGHIGNEGFKGLKLSNINQIRDMVDSGLATVGSHTHAYHYISKDNNPPFLDPKNHSNFKDDIELSIKSLEDNFNIDKKYFSYPYGFGTPETDEILLDLDFSLIFSLGPGIVKVEDPSFYTKKVLVTKSTWKDIVKWVEE